MRWEMSSYRVFNIFILIHDMTIFKTLVYSSSNIKSTIKLESAIKIIKQAAILWERIVTFGTVCLENCYVKREKREKCMEKINFSSIIIPELRNNVNHNH